MTTPAFTIDRRPRGGLTITDGRKLSDPKDLARNDDYLSAGLSATFGFLREKMDRGFPVPFLHLPQGAPYGAAFTSALWPLTSPADRRYYRHLPPWLTELDLYIGFSITSPNTYSMAGARSPDLTKPADAEFFRESLAPFLNALRAQNITLKTLWLDAAAADPTAFLTLASQFPRTRLGGESFPIYDAGPGAGPGGRTYNLDMPKILSAPWWTTFGVFDAFSTAAPIPWSVDPSLTECHVCAVPNYVPDESQVTDLVSRGFIVDSWYGTTGDLDAHILSSQGY